METLIEAVKNLTLWTSDETTEETTIRNTEEILTALNMIVEIITKDENDRNALCETLMQNNVSSILTKLFNGDYENSALKIKEKTAEVVAEIAKTEIGRKHCGDGCMISALVQLLTSEHNEVNVQGCRALGNICYDNDFGRSVVHEHGGTDKLLQILQSENARKEGKEQLRTVATGFLLNLINTYDITQERVLELDVLSIICDYLAKYNQEEDVCIHTLLILNCLADSDNGRRKIIEKNICGVLVGLMEIEVSTEVVEAVLELIGNLAEDDVVKYQLAATGFCHNLLKFLKMGQITVQDEEALNVTKVACDLIVLMLTGDESMEYLYASGRGEVYEEIISWLTAKDETLQTAAALAIGNFARKDSHCTRMVSDGIIKQLLDLLKKHNTNDGDIRMQHAILSALRNLAIPRANKGPLLEMGVVDVILPMISVQTFPVVFKLLGTLRMLVDGQEDTALKLGKTKECLTRIVEWCGTEDHPGVKGEANRLLAWLIKNSKSTDVMKLLIECGGFRFLVAMAVSEHEVMQNEALIALNLICSSKLDTVKDVIDECELSSNLCKLLTDEELNSDIKCKVLTLIASASDKSDKIKEDLIKSGILNTVKKVSESENELLSEAAKAVIQLFESG